MKQIFKHPRTFVTGLAAVGIAPALATVAQADTEPFPAELTQLIAEAKALNIRLSKVLIKPLVPMWTCKPIMTIWFTNFRT